MRGPLPRGPQQLLKGRVVAERPERRRVLQIEEVRCFDLPEETHGPLPLADERGDFGLEERSTLPA